MCHSTIQDGSRMPAICRAVLFSQPWKQSFLSEASCQKLLIPQLTPCCISTQSPIIQGPLLAPMRTLQWRPKNAILCLRHASPPCGHLLLRCSSWSQCSTLANPVPFRALISNVVMFCLAQAMMSGSLINDLISSMVM